MPLILIPIYKCGKCEDSGLVVVGDVRAPCKCAKGLAHRPTYQKLRLSEESQSWLEWYERRVKSALDIN